MLKKKNVINSLSKFKQFFIFILLVGGVLIGVGLATKTAAAAQQTAKWRKALPGNAQTSSPVLEDINNDGRQDVVVGTDNGWVIAFSHSGTELWRRNLAPFYGVSSQLVFGSITAADIDNNGDMEIIVPTGDAGSSVCYPGGIMVLDHNGNKASGSWPYLTVDQGVPPSGCPDGVLGTPAAGDIDGNGDLEIIFGSADKRIYALHHDGSLVNGFPPNSYLAFRFPTWSDLQGKTADTIWSSVSLGDIDNDGFLDILTGADEGNFGKDWGGETIGWYCPYTYWSTEYCGGTLQVINRFGTPTQGNILNGGRYPILNWEIIQSTPAIADLNGDGTLDFVYGTGTFYSDRTTNPYANRIRAIDGATGRDLAGWDNSGVAAFWGKGRVTGSPTPSSPAVGDMDGDGDLEVAILGTDKKVYAFHHNGSPVAGFPVTAVARTMTTNFGVYQNIVMGDYDGDSDMELFLTIGSDIAIINGNGSHLTDTGSNGNKPSYVAASGAINSPALGDLDNNGKLDLVRATTELVVWELPNSSNRADWPQYKNNAAREGRLSMGAMTLSSDVITKLVESNSGTVSSTFTINNPGSQSISWSINTSALAGGVSINKNSGTLDPGESTIVQVFINTNSRAVGSYGLGSMTVAAETGGTDVPGSPQDIDVVLLIANDLFTTFVPIIAR
ncbi:MAG: FG-GAP-like repeat-containing protein [Ardenticatenaceae bacterium]|nr:FG-GAP-like repeat-containing protein [Ardenticatenaceae bacterium]